jgi:hypothetical protein
VAVSHFCRMKAKRTLQTCIAGEKTGYFPQNSVVLPIGNLMEKDYNCRKLKREGNIPAGTMGFICGMRT